MMNKRQKINKFIFAAIILIALILISYWKIFDNDFVDWDDFTYVVNNDLVRNPGDSYLKDVFTTPVSSNYHPLTILSMRLNNNECKSCIEGISPAPFIRGNVILHILNTLLVLPLIFLLTNRNVLAAVITALLFGLHPMHVESVAWIAERKDVLYTFFFLSGLLAWLMFKRGKKGKTVWLFFSFLLFIFSCLSKAVAVVFPVVLMLINFWISKKDSEKTVLSALREAFSPKNLLLLLPFFIVSLFIGIMAFRIQSGQNFLGFLDLTKNMPDVVNEIGPFTVFQRIQIACYGLIEYLIKFFLPFNLSALHAYPTLAEFKTGSFAVKLIITTITTVLILLFIIRSLKTNPVYAFGFGFYFITIALVLQFITVGLAITAERYSYVPYIGLSVIPAMLIAGSPKKLKNILLIITGGFVIMLMVLTSRQIRIWRNTETLWSNVIDKDPQLELPRRSRGKYYIKKSLRAKTELEKKNLEEKALADFIEAIKSNTRSADVFEGAGVIFGIKGETDKALLLLNKAVEIDPLKGSAYFNRALIYGQLNKKEEAIKDYNLALVYKPQMALEITNNRSNLLIETGRFREAILDFNYLISVEGDNFLYYYNRGYAKVFINDIPGAIADYQKALTLNPDDAMTQEALRRLMEVF
jgi:protein O-mannosyl-transferase